MRFIRQTLLLLLTAIFLAAPALPAFTESRDGPGFISLGAFAQDASGQPASILWRVLARDETQALLLSEQVLDARAAQAKGMYLGFEQSTLAAWLNGDFLETAFSPQERASLLEQGNGMLVSLPSAEDLRNEAYGFLRDRDRAAKGTAYALARGLEAEGNGSASYWISNAAQSMKTAQRRALASGELGYIRADAGYVGVRPLVLLSLTRMPVAGGEGTKEAPFTLAYSGLPLPSPTPEPAPTPEPLPGDFGGISTEGFPALTKEGFLPPGEDEYVFIDAENGRWRFANQDLRIVITRHEDLSVPLRWLGAEIFVREGTPAFRMFGHNPEHMLEARSIYKEKPAVIARNNKLVFSMDGDYFLYRVHNAKASGKKMAIGVVIRNHEILVDSPASETRNLYPPLDMMALFPDGDMRVYKARELSAQELVDLGARDVLSFGPWLIRDGVINNTYKTYGTTIQPRAAFGMVEKGHYWAVIVEGRIRPSKGMTTFEVGALMKELGCAQAFNLDGGWTSAMVFMGRQLNQLDKSGVHDNARPQNEVMGIGTTNAYEEGRAP